MGTDYPPPENHGQDCDALQVFEQSSMCSKYHPHPLLPGPSPPTEVFGDLLGDHDLELVECFQMFKHTATRMMAYRISYTL